MSGHLIVCGAGGTAAYTTRELLSVRRQVVLICEKRDQVDYLRSEIGDTPLIVGDPASDEVLLAAGVERAAGIVACTDSDKGGVGFVPLSGGSGCHPGIPAGRWRHQGHGDADGGRLLWGDGAAARYSTNRNMSRRDPVCSLRAATGSHGRGEGGVSSHPACVGGGRRASACGAEDAKRPGGVRLGALREPLATRVTPIRICWTERTDPSHL